MSVPFKMVTVEEMHRLDKGNAANQPPGQREQHIWEATNIFGVGLVCTECPFLQVGYK